MATSIGWISETTIEESWEMQNPCRRCGGRGKLQDNLRTLARPLPNGGICYRCEGSGADPKAKAKPVKVETVKVEEKPLMVTFMEDGESFEDLLDRMAAEKARRDEADKKAQEKFAETGDIFDLFYFLD